MSDKETSNLERLESIDQQIEIDTLRAECDRLRKLHAEDMRVTNESASFHMKRCRELEREVERLNRALMERGLEGI